LAVIFAAIGGLLATIHPAEATNILVFQTSATGTSRSRTWTDVFGSNFTSYDSYADWTHPPSHRVYAFRLPGRAAESDTSLIDFLSTSGSTVLDWVSHGGRLLLQSAGTSLSYSSSRSVRGRSTIRLPSAMRNFFRHADCRRPGRVHGLSDAGYSGWSNSGQRHGLWSGLTTFMTGNSDGLPIIAGNRLRARLHLVFGPVGLGIHFSGPSLVDDE